MTARAGHLALLVAAAVSLALVLAGLYRVHRQVEAAQVWCWTALEGPTRDIPITMQVHWRPLRGHPLDHALAGAVVARGGLAGDAFMLDHRDQGVVLVTSADHRPESQRVLGVLTSGTCP